MTARTLSPFLALIVALSAVVGIALPARAQQGGALVVTSCGSQTLDVGKTRSVSQDTTGNQCVTTSGGSGGTVTANQGTPASSANAWPVTSVAAYATTTQTGFTTSGTPNTFTQLLASSTTRKSCTIQYTGAGTLLVFYGLTASGTTTNSFQVASGQTINCAGSFNPLGDAVNVASATASDIGVVATQ